MFGKEGHIYYCIFSQNNMQTVLSVLAENSLVLGDLFVLQPQPHILHLKKGNPAIK